MWRSCDQFLFSLIHDRRVGDYFLPEGSIVIGAGNSVQDSAIVKPMSAALLNEPFSSPRSWHMLSDSLHQFDDEISDGMLELLAFGCSSPHHAGQFKAFIKQVRNKYAHRIKELPPNKEALSAKVKETVHTSKALLKQVAKISLEMVQMVVADGSGDQGLPDWFMVEIARDLPRIIVK